LSRSATVTKEQEKYAIREMHKRIYKYHFGSRSMATQIHQAEYFWPTMEADYNVYVKKYVPCKKHRNITHVK